MIDDRVFRVRTFLNNQQYYDPEGTAHALGISPATWPLAGLLWDSAIILAKLMMQFDIADKRILEVGCGLGLSSLVLNSRGADVTATDIHPEVHPNLRLNTRLNGGGSIPYFEADWGVTGGSCRIFDLVIASDVLYQPSHPAMLARFITDHAHETAQIIVVDPARGGLSRFGKALNGYGFTRFNKRIGEKIMQTNGFKGQVHTFKKNN